MPATFSSSSSSSESSSLPSSRSTTPPSDIEQFCKELPAYQAAAHVFLPIASSARVLRSVFEKHASEDCLGVIFANSTASLLCAEFTSGAWTAMHLSIGNDLDVKYFLSTAFSNQGLFDTQPHALSTGLTSARHLLLISQASLRSIVSVSVADGNATLYILERPSFAFPPLASTLSFSHDGTVAQGNVPTLEEWERVWSAWDLVTLQMIPQEMLHQKPIDLRHKCLFYIGHIPTFLDMLLSKAIGGLPTEPKYFWNIFERGIDPHVDDPNHCHNHSEVPEKDEDWPTLDSIIVFRNNVRARLRKLYLDLQAGRRAFTRSIARTIVMCLEHESFHIETLLYMLMQRAGSGTLPPPGFTVPPWEVLAEQWNSIPLPSSPTVLVGPATLVLGHHDSEAEDGLPGVSENVKDHTFGWDNESPPRTVQVGAFKAEWRPVTNREFETFRNKQAKGVVDFPKSWVDEDGEVKVRTIYGPVPMAIAAHWPMLTSYDDLSAYAISKGGRLPTEAELRLFLDTYDVGHEGGANIGFRNWHCVPATTGLEAYDGKGSNGGVWEWTSTVFDAHEGLAPTKYFTGYSTDFFDSKHHVALGASYATVPRLGRRTLRNFYQHNYPYPWIGARVVYDV
ncbi:hypothetical protein K443DRAFT_82998 [Laccaria amethystina LaAM-08-1]|uniref:DUF323 domain-containing protein n=1 Tax=Laccaria amethystina LaAM-08-1 TaxID=1095629 RepID=A0A0C9YFV4_9AGAR|nr:hypothetical protein K443DRAFT_82998 [Laccaria amethystina LaAM-08-1]